MLEKTIKSCAPCVAITGVGGAAGITCIKALKSENQSIKIVGFDCDELSSGFDFVDKKHVIPPAQSNAFLKSLLNYCIDEKVDVLIPTVDEELFVLSRFKDEFIKLGVKIAVSNQDTIRLTNDKWLTYESLKKAELPIPMTWLPETFDNSYFPVIVKPRVGRGGRDIYICHDLEDVSFALKKARSPIIQEFLSYQEYSVDTFSNLDNSEYVVVPRKTLMRKYGLMWRGCTEHNSIIESTCVKAIKYLNIVGPCCFQGCFDGKNFKIFEINCRIGGTTSLSVAAGVNIPLMTAELFYYGKTDIPREFKSLAITRSTTEHFINP